MSADSGLWPLAGPAGGACVREQPGCAACGDQARGAGDPPMQGRAWQDRAAAPGHQQGGAGGLERVGVVDSTRRQPESPTRLAFGALAAQPSG